MDTTQSEQEQPAKRNPRPTKMYHAHRDDNKQRGCMYCRENHKAVECNKITNLSDRRQFCSISVYVSIAYLVAIVRHTVPANRPVNIVASVTTRRFVKQLTRQTNIKSHGVALTTNQNGEGLFPVVIVEVNGIKCRALIHSGAGSSYASAKLIELLRMKPAEMQTKRIDMLLSSRQARLEVYDLELKSVDHQFSLSVKATKVNKTELLSIENPNYHVLIERYAHLNGVKVHNYDTKASLPVHFVLGSWEYARIKTETKPRIGKENDPIAELTKFGWFLMSSGKEFDKNTMLLTQTSQSDYENLCRLDLLGLRDVTDHDQSIVFDEFKERLTRSPEGWYETTLPWKANHPPLPSNKDGSLKRLHSLNRKLQREGLTEEYNAIIKEQLAEGVIEKAPPVSQSKEFYIPHKGVVRKTAETTKMRIIYGASAPATPDSPSLNDCLHPGPALQNRLWDILIQQRGYPLLLVGDIKKAFLQIRIHESERDALRFHWRPSHLSDVETYRFTRVLLGLAPSPFLLGGVLECHLDAWAKKYPKETKHLRRSFYFDDLLSGGQDVQQARTRKEVATEIMNDASFELHKWHSNEPQVEDRPRSTPY